MNDDEQFRKVLGVIDEPARADREFEERLWAEVRQTLVRRHAGGPVATSAEVTVLRSGSRPIRRTRLRYHLLVAAAAGILAIIGVVSVSDRSDAPQQVPAARPTAGPLPTAEPQPMLDDAGEACARYQRTTPDLDRLVADLRAGRDVVADLDRARTVHRALLADLEAAGLDDRVVATLQIIAGSLDQARLRAVDGDGEAAARAAENAVTELNTLAMLLPADVARCVG